MRILLALTVMLAANTAVAVPVQWTFQDVYFDDGATLTGSFIFDVDSETIVQKGYEWIQAYYFDIEIETGLPNDGGPVTGDNFLFYEKYDRARTFTEDYVGDYVGDANGPPALTGDPSSYQNGLSSVGNGFSCGPGQAYACTWSLDLDFAAPLTNAGGTVTLSGNEFISGVILGTYGSNDRSIVSGSIVGNALVPVPAAVWLFASGLGLLGWLRRRQTAQY